MWTWSAGRKELLEVVGGRIDAAKEARPVERRAKLGLLGAEELLFVWPERPDGQSVLSPLPPIIAVEVGRQREFFAWVSTFLTGFSPFTAHCRVVDPRALASVEAIHSEQPRLGGLEAACVALILVEAQVAGEPVPTVGLCRRSLSFGFARAIALGGLRQNEAQIADGWIRLQQRTGSRRPLAQMDSLRQAWRAVDRLADAANATQLEFERSESQAGISAACRELLASGAIRRDTWASLVQSTPDLWDAPEEMEGSRESRVTCFERSVARLRRGSKGNQTEASFAVGYLASRVAPGSIEHLSLVLGSAQDFAGSEYWYALAAGLSKDGEARNLGRGVGGRLLRDLLRHESLSAPPEADISMPELEVLLTGDQPPEIPASFPGYLQVELALGVTTPVRWAGRTAAEHPGAAASQNREEEVALRRLGDILDEANYLFRKLAGARGRSDRDKRGR